MKKMLVLLNRPEDIEGRLSELREIAITHGITKMYLARVLRPFGSRVRSIVAPHKLDIAVRMSDAAASKRLSQIAEALCKEGIDAEPISPGIPAEKIDEFIENNDIDLIVSGDGRSGLCRWLSGSLSGSHVQFLCEHVFAEDRATFQCQKGEGNGGSF